MKSGPDDVVSLVTGLLTYPLSVKLPKGNQYFLWKLWAISLCHSDVGGLGADRRIYGILGSLANGLAMAWLNVPWRHVPAPPKASSLELGTNRGHMGFASGIS